MPRTFDAAVDDAALVKRPAGVGAHVVQGMDPLADPNHDEIVDTGPHLGRRGLRQEREVRDGDQVSLGGLPATVERISEEQAAALAGESAAQAEGADRMRSRLRDALAPADLLQCFLQAAMELTRSQRGFVVTIGPDGKLIAEAAAGLSPDAMRDERFQGSVGAVRQALEKRGPVVLSDVRNDPRLGKRPSVVSLGIVSLACLPIRRGATVVGAIYVDSRKRGPALSELELETLEDMAQHVGAILGLSPEADRPQGRPARDALVAQLQQRIEELLPVW